MTSVGGRPPGLETVALGPFGTPEFQRRSNNTAAASRLLWHEENERITEIMTSCAERAVGLRPPGHPVESENESPPDSNSIDPMTLLRHRIAKWVQNRDSSSNAMYLTQDGETYRSVVSDC